MLYAIAWGLVYTIFKLLFFFRVEGRENIPENGRLLICANHTSMSDPIFIALALGPHRMRFMAKEELFHIKPLGWLLSSLGAFPVNRAGSDIRAIRLSLTALKEEKRLIVFPEGHRVRDKSIASETKAGAGMLALRTGAPVLPIYISEHKKMLHRAVIRVGAPVTFSPEGKPDRVQYIATADKIMDRIRNLGADKISV